MAKPSIYRDFVKEMKRHWRAVLPNVVNVAEPIGHLPMASTFHAGRSAVAPIDVYLHFQTHSTIGGLFTINVILATEGEFRADIGNRIRHKDDLPVLGDFHAGATRIGAFLKTRRGDRWWQLCRDEVKEQLGRALGRSVHNPDWLYPADYDDHETVVRDAVVDVTFCVHLTLSQLGIPGAKKP